jgi:uncharacterized membrane protein
MPDPQDRREGVARPRPGPRGASVHDTRDMRSRTGVPLTASGRIIGVDVARCVALVGMIATHALPERDADGGLGLGHVIAGGRASALFAVLAGVSLALMSGGTRPVRGTQRRAVTAGLAARALTIALIGLFLGGLPTTIAIILTYYGVLFLLGLPFLGLGWKALATIGGAWLLAAPVVSHLVRPHLPPRGFTSPSPEALAHPWQLLTELTFTGYYPAVSWLGYLLVGMAIGRTDLRRRRTATVVAVLGAVLAGGSWLVSELLLGRSDVTRALLGTAPEPGMTVDQLRRSLEEGTAGSTPTESWWWLAVHAPHSGTPFDLLHTTGTAMLTLGVCLVLARLWPRATAVLFGAGAMTLTLYTLHVVLRTPPFLPGDDTRTFAWHVAIVLLIGAAFRLMAWRGPLEAMATELARQSSEQTRRT